MGPSESRDLGIQETQAGRHRTAYELLLPWVRDHPGDSEARLHAAWSAAFLGRTFEAAELLMGLDEGDPRVQLLWGKLLLDKRDAVGAIEILEPLASDAPPELDLQVRRLLAKAWMATGRADRAIPLLEGRVGDDPTLALELALARYEAGDVKGANEVLAPHSKAVLTRLQNREDSPTGSLEVAVLFEYGRFQVTAAQHSEALPFLEAAVELAPDCRQCWQQIAQAYAALGERQQARSAQQHFESLLRRDIPAAERERRQAQDQQDPTGRVLREASEAFEGGRTGEALAMLRTESGLRPEDPRPYYLAAEILVEGGQTAEALVLAEAAIQVAPWKAEGYYVRGIIFRALGKVEEARQDFVRVMEIAPDHAAAAEGLASLSVD